MARINSTGIKREQLVWALQSPLVVGEARNRDSCLLCRGDRVNEAGLCTLCASLLNDEESRLAERWTSGMEP
ncbi:MAG: hypothetical protein JSS66_01770 [Armatimonadetes bacterium]|nr:hypothetical protein [Armatimonadota bacterium]